MNIDIDGDGDGLPDCIEVGGWRSGTYDQESNPGLFNSDADSLSDGQEARLLTVAEFVDAATTELNGSWFPDLLELGPGARIVAPLSDPMLEDSDGDGILDDRELQVLGTDPFLVDSDFDGIADNDEVLNGLDPLRFQLPQYVVASGLNRAGCFNAGSGDVYLDFPVVTAAGQILEGCVTAVDTSCVDRLAVDADGVECVDDVTALLVLASRTNNRVVFEAVVTDDGEVEIIGNSGLLGAVPLVLRPGVLNPTTIGVVLAGAVAFVVLVYLIDVLPNVFADEVQTDRRTIQDLSDATVDQMFNDIISRIPTPQRGNSRTNAAIRTALKTCVATQTTDAIVSSANDIPGWSFVADPTTGVLNRLGLGGIVQNTSGALQHVCGTLPVYLPGEKTNAGGGTLSYTTHHIRQALGIPGSDLEQSPNGTAANPGDGSSTFLEWSNGVRVNPTWVYLTYNPAGAPGAQGSRGPSRTWLRRTPPCNDRTVAGLPSGSVCDEYPFITTDQGGPTAPASVKFVPGNNAVLGDTDLDPEGSAQGGDLGAFLRACGVDTGNSYLVIPLPDTRVGVNAAVEYLDDDAAEIIPLGQPLPEPIAQLFRSQRYCPTE